MATRKRDYKAEEERRNIRARALGFTSRAQMRTARARKLIPSGTDFKQDRAAAEAKTRDYSLAHNTQRAQKMGVMTGGPSLAEVKSKNKAWSETHSRQTVTEYNPRWGERRQRMFYDAFVKWWSIPNDERAFRATYDYMIEFGKMPKKAYQDNPYASR